MYDECLTKKRGLERPCGECGSLQGFLLPHPKNLDLNIEERLSALVQSRLELGAPSAAYAVWSDAVSSLPIDNEELINGNQQLLTSIHNLSAQSFYKAQLSSLDKFPNIKCTECGHLQCLKCGKPAHAASCISLMPEILDDQRPCPRCFCMIEREAEGCNEMECEVCGKRFCWECLQPWSRSCGIYQCSHPLAQPQPSSQPNGKRQHELAWELHDKIKKR